MTDNDDLTNGYKRLSTVSSHAPAALSAPRGEQRSTVPRALIEPASHADAQREFDLLHAEILDIQGQIAARAAVWHEGQELAQWKKWRGTAVAALRAKEARYSFLKQWLHRHGGAAHEIDRARRGDLRAIVADLVTVLDAAALDLKDPDAKLALQRLIAWQQRWLDTNDNDDAAL